MNTFDPVRTTRAVALRGITLAAAVTGLAIALGPRLAVAQSASEMAVRRELIEEAQRASAAGDHTRALNLANRAAQISVSTSLRAFLAQEQATLGQLAEAFGNADQCVTEATRDTTMHNRESILATCRNLVSQIRGRIAHVTVDAPNPPPAGLHVTIASQPLSNALLGVPYIVTPGTVVIEATADGLAPYRQEVHPTTGQTLEVRLWTTGSANPAGQGSGAGNPVTNTPAGPGGQASVAAIPAPGGSREPNGAAIRAPGASGQAPVAAIPAPGGSHEPNVAAIPPQNGSREPSGGTTLPGSGSNRGIVTPVGPVTDADQGPGVAPFVVAGAGVLVAGAGAVLYVLSDSAFNRLAQNCQTDAQRVVHCEDTADNRAQLQTVQTYDLIAPIAIGVGAAALVGGLVWRFAAGSGGQHEQPPRARLEVSPTLGGVMVGIGGTL